MIEKRTKYYKFLNLKDGVIRSDSGFQSWRVGEEYSVTGKINICYNGFHASETAMQALSYVTGNVLAIVEAWGDSQKKSDKVCYRSMRIVRAYEWTKADSVSVAIYAAEQVIKIYEDRYPNDSRPRDAIKAAKAYLSTLNKKTQAAAYAAYAAANAANAAANAANAAYAAAYAAAKKEMSEKIDRFVKSRIKKLHEIKESE